MTTAATSLLGLALPVTGELQGTWGTTVNDSITSLLDTAVAGTTTLSTDGDVTLSTTTLAANQARQAILLCSGARTAIRTITAPAQSKIYTIINATTGGYAVKLVGVGPTTGLTIPNGASAVVAWNGSDFIEIGSSTVGNLTVNGNLTVTGTSTLTGAATLTANPTLSAGTANGVAYLNGSKVVTTGSALTFDGTLLGVTTSSGADTTLLTLTGNSGVRQQFNPNNSTATKYNWRIDVNGLVDQTWSLVPSTAVGGSTFSTPVYQANGNGTQIWSVGSSEAMRLTSTGLGIGTSSPGARLTTRAAANSYTAGALQIESLSGTYKSYITNVGGLLLFSNSSSTDQLILDSSGNLGLGVTPSAWSTPAFNFGSNAVGSLSVIGTTTSLGNNINYNSGYKYTTSSTAGLYQISGNTHYWFTAPSGTAGNAITFTQAMTLDAGGNLLLGGTTSKVTGVSGSGSGQTISGAVPTLALWSGATASNYFNLSQVNTDTYVWNLASGFMAFGTGNTERARIDSSGRLLVGMTSAVGIENVQSTGAISGSSQYSYFAQGNTTSYTCYALRTYSSSASAVVGSITFTGSATAYNTSSDYRLKDNQQPLTGSGEFIDALQPKTWEWKTDGSKGVGFIAHEVQAISPGSVVGEKDAVDEEGKPIMQAMEYGSAEFIANIIAELQSLRKRVAQLEGAK